jgi:hypothetical protein
MSTLAVYYLQNCILCKKQIMNQLKKAMHVALRTALRYSSSPFHYRDGILNYTHN